MIDKLNSNQYVLGLICIFFYVGPKWFCTVGREDEDGPEQEHRCHTPARNTGKGYTLFILSPFLRNNQMRTALFMVFADGWH